MAGGGAGRLAAAQSWRDRRSFKEEGQPARRADQRQHPLPGSAVFQSWRIRWSCFGEALPERFLDHLAHAAKRQRRTLVLVVAVVLGREIDRRQVDLS
jgi:hypothetical protein